jgi:hypothetical protein
MFLTKFQWASSFSGGLAGVFLPDGNQGYIDKKGRLVIPGPFAWAGNFVDGLAPVVTMDAKETLIDKTGASIVK